MAVEKNSLMTALVRTDGSPKRKGRVDFAKAMQKMGFTSVFDIVRLPKAAFARQLARFSDADADLAYDNAMGYAALIARLYREYKTSSGTFQQLAQRSGVRALVPLGPTFPNLFKENWDEFCKVGAIAAIDSPVAYLSALRVFIQQLETTSEDPKRILLDKRRPDLKDLLITEESTFTPRPMLEIVNEVLDKNLRAYLDGNQEDKTKSTHEVLAERRYPFELPYNFYHHQCQLGLADKKPGLGALNYRVSLLLPIQQPATNKYGEVQKPVLQAQRLLSGLSPQQQQLLIEPSVFSNFYVTRQNVIDGWKSAGTTHLRPHIPLSTCFLLLSDQADIGTVTPVAEVPTTSGTGGTKNIASVTFRAADETETGEVQLRSANFTSGLTGGAFLNFLHPAAERPLVFFLTGETAKLPKPDKEGYTATFDLITATATGTVAEPVKLASQRVTLTLDEEYHLNAREQAFFKQSLGIEGSDSSLLQMADLTSFMQRTGLNAEQVEMLLSRRTHAPRLSPNCPSLSPQHAGLAFPGVTGKVLPFPHPNHYGACYVNGTGAALYDSERVPTATTIYRDQFDNAMGLEQVDQGSAKIWRLTKTSLNRFDRLQRMVRLQRWTGIPFAKLDTLIISAIRAEGEENLGMELNENTLRALGVYRYLNQHYGIDPQEFAALMHDLTPYASGKGEVPLFDLVFNRVQLFDTALILDQTELDLSGTTPADQKTLLQLCAGLGVKPTEDSLLLIAKQTEKYLGDLKRDLPTVSSLYRQARIARLFGLSVADLLTLASLLGGHRYKTALASGQLSPRTTPAVPDILDVLMQLAWAVDWLKDSQQTVAQLQQRLGPDVPLAVKRPSDKKLGGNPPAKVQESEPLPDDLLKRLARLHDDTVRSVVTKEQVAALGLPGKQDSRRKTINRSTSIDWFRLLISHALLDEDGLLRGLDHELTLVDDPLSWLRNDVDQMLKPISLPEEVKQVCADKLVELLLGAHDRQARLLEGLFQATAKLPPERCVAVIHWANYSVYTLLVDALEGEATPQLIERFQSVSRHAEIVLSLRLSDSALRLFLVNPAWLGRAQYPVSNSEPSLADLYLFERFSHWLHSQSEPEDKLLSYFSLANPAKSKLKNKALRQVASETANSALARLLDWPETEITALTATLSEKRACSMAQVDWVRRCQASAEASGLSVKALLQATELDAKSTLDNWKAVGEAVMAASSTTDSSLATV